MATINAFRKNIGKKLTNVLPDSVPFLSKPTGNYEDKAKKIEECFHDVVIQNMYSMTTKEEEQRRFKQAVIHIICTNRNIDSKQLARSVAKLYRSNEDIPLHDDVVSIDKMQYECNKIRKCFSDVGIHSMYVMTKREGKQRRFKQAIIHAIYMNPSIDVERELPQAVLRLYHSKEDIPSHDDIVTVDGIKDDTEEKDSQVLQNAEEQDVQNPLFYKTRTGLVLVLYNDFKGQGEMDRNGRGGRDSNELTTLFQKFNIQAIEGGGNLKNRDEFNRLMEKAINYINDVKPDVFICVVSTHGGEAVEGDVSQKAKEKGSHVVKHEFVLDDGQPIFTRELTAKFSNSNCKGLQGKPRLFFIQACRSRTGVDEVDVGFEEGLKSDAQSDATKKIELPKGTKKNELPDAIQPKSELPDSIPPKHELPDAKGKKVELPTKPPGTKTRTADSVQKDSQPGYYEVTEDICYEDCLVMFSSPPGKVAWGDSYSTSWLIDCLKVAFDAWEKHPDLELMEVLTIAAQNMSELEATSKEYKCVPSLQHKLTKGFRLKAKH